MYVTSHSDLGDGARILITDAGTLDARVNLGDRVLVTTASYGSGAGTVTELRPADLELLRTIVDRIGEHG
jgi:hypothetical protein